MKNGIIITAVGFMLLLASFLFSEGKRIRSMEIVLIEGEYDSFTQEIEGDLAIPTRYAIFFSFIVITTGVVKIILSKVNRIDDNNLLTRAKNKQSINSENEINKLNNTTAVENETHQHLNEKGYSDFVPSKKKPILTSFKWLILITFSLLIAPLFAGVIFELLYHLFTGDSYFTTEPFSIPKKRYQYAPLYLAAFQAAAGLWTFFILRSALKNKSSSR